MSAFCPVAQLKRIIGEKDFPPEMARQGEYQLITTHSKTYLLPSSPLNLAFRDHRWLSKVNARFLSPYDEEDLINKLSWERSLRDLLPLSIRHRMDNPVANTAELIAEALRRGDITLYEVRKPIKYHAPAKQPAIPLVDEIPPPPANTSLLKPKTPTHWVEFCYQYEDNKKPISNVPFVLTMPDGSEINGMLPDNGKVRIEDIKKPGEATIAYGEPNAEQEAKQLRQEIKQALDTIIEEERKEAAEIDGWYDEHNGFSQYFIRQYYAGKGIVNGAWGLLQWVGDVAEAVSQFGILDSMIQAGIKEQYDYQSDEWKQHFLKNFGEEHKKKLVKALGFDPDALTRENLAEAYETYILIKNDPESKKIIWDFIKDYASAQHELEVIEAGGELGFEFILAAVLAAFTGGTGAATLAPRLSAKMPKLGQKFRQLATAIKKVKLRKTTKGHTNKSTTTDVKRPEKKPLKPKKPTAQQQATAKKLGVNPKWVDPDGNPIWPPNNGVDGQAVVKKLEKGTIIDRYGSDGGQYFSPDGTPFEQRALPKSSLDKPYKRFEVIEPFEVEAGKIAPWFDQPGGGTQFYSSDKVFELIDDGYIKEI